MNKIIRYTTRLFKYLRFPQYAIINTFIHPYSTLLNVKIGSNTNINGKAYISGGVDGCEIGKYCAIAYNFRVRNENHHTCYANVQASFSNTYGFKSVMGNSKGKIEIGNSVWIGDNVIILSGVKIGNGAVIAAGSVVTKDIPAFSIAAGVPAKIIKKRFEQPMIALLEEIKWWDWQKEKIKRNRAFFEMDLEKASIEEVKSAII